jgi:hypothetical protein
MRATAPTLKTNNVEPLERLKLLSHSPACKSKIDIGCAATDENHSLWNRALRQILMDPQIATQFAGFGLRPSGMKISETNAFIATEPNRRKTMLATRADGLNTPRYRRASRYEPR